LAKSPGQAEQITFCPSTVIFRQAGHFWNSIMTIDWWIQRDLTAWRN
jgi:hypothetical protein